MRELTCKEIQNISLEMLKHFDDFAKRNNITYYMAGGTLLGAVRHKGFIPWDDDVDLMIPRPDYDKLIKCYKNDGIYRFDSCEISSDYPAPFGRIWDTRTEVIFDDNIKEKTMGVFIDLFPIDGYPTIGFLSKLHMYRLKLNIAKIHSAKRVKVKRNEKHYFIKLILKALCRKDPNFYALKVTRYAKKYKYDLDYRGVATTTEHLFKERNSKRNYQKTVYLSFEDIILPAISGYDGYLTQLYGDYMKLPDKDKRVSNHDFKAYKID